VKKLIGNIFSAALALLLVASNTYGQWFVDLETGLVFGGYNDVRIPRDTGTEFSLTEDLETNSSLFYRVRVGYMFNSKHSISLFAAPLSLNASGKIDKPVRFFEEDFAASVPLDAVYRFNSFRLTYRYDFLRKGKWRLGIGFTAKIRDAAVSLESENKRSEKKNVGFVPLINFRVEWRINRKLGILLHGDALAAPQGRAEDVLLALQIHLNETLTLKAGYRILEGGANVGEVYNFALLHYLVLGTTFHF